MSLLTSALGSVRFPKASDPEEVDEEVVRLAGDQHDTKLAA